MKTIFAGVLALLLTGGFGCRGVSPEVRALSRPVSLEIWGVFDDQDAYNQAISDYRAAHPYVSLNYRKLRPEEYERELLNALAEDRGPDILMVHNTWVRGYLPKLAALPRSVTIAELVTKGTVKKETAYEVHTKNTLSIRALQNLFPDQVRRDAVITVPDEKTGAATLRIWGLPLSIDTLALYWNRDLLNAAGIADPPANWTSFQQAVKKLVKSDSGGNIIQSGAALGTAKNVERAADILSLLMIQNGTKMTDESGYPTFHITPPEVTGHALPPGIEALVFYTDFANPNKEVYTWNDSLPNSLDAFISGQSALFLGYNYHLPLIRARAPKLRFGISPAPQIPGNPEKNFANYWLYAVSKKSKKPEIAWDFIQFLTSEKSAQKYLEITEKPTALRSLIPGQTENVDLGVFAGQILTAESWYQGADAAAAETAFRDMINEVLGEVEPAEAINTAVTRIGQTIQPR